MQECSIHKTTEPFVTQLGPSYGRKTMIGLLSAQGCHVGQNRVGASLQCVNPGLQIRRTVESERRRNPVPYTARYFREKVHIDQNKKLVMFGTTHICAIDGFSGKVVAFCSMPVKNNCAIYEYVYM